MTGKLYPILQKLGGITDQRYGIAYKLCVMSGKLYRMRRKIYAMRNTVYNKRRSVDVTRHIEYGIARHRYPMVEKEYRKGRRLYGLAICVYRHRQNVLGLCVLPCLSNVYLFHLSKLVYRHFVLLPIRICPAIIDIRKIPLDDKKSIV